MEKTENKRYPFFGRDGTVDRIVFYSPIKKAGSVVNIGERIKIKDKAKCMDAGEGDASGGGVGVGGSRPMVP